MAPLLLLLAACTPSDLDTVDTGDVPMVCWTDLAAGDAAPVATGFADGTEGVSFVEGRLFVTDGGGVAQVGADGSVMAFATLDHALGLAPASGGMLVADPGEFSFDGSGDDGRLLFVDFATAAVTEVATGMPNPNFVAATPWGDVLVSDDTNPLIASVRDGAVTTWLDTVDSPNGMALSPDGRTLYVVSTFLPDPPLWRVPVTEDGTPGTPEVVVTFDTGAAPDGLAVGADGAVWVALNLANEIARVDPETGDAETFSTAASTPASLAFGQGEDFDPCSLYVTELYGDTVWRVATGGPGATLTTPTAR